MSSSWKGDVWGSHASNHTEKTSMGVTQRLPGGMGDLRQHSAMALVTQLSLPGRS